MNNITLIFGLIMFVCLIASLNSMNKKIEKLTNICKGLETAQEFKIYTDKIKKYAEKTGKKNVYFEISIKPHEESENLNIDEENKIYLSDFND